MNPSKSGLPEHARGVHAWFGLTYANYLVVPRSVLQSMPEDWQHRLTALLGEMQDSFGHLDWPDYSVRAVGERGRYRRDPIPGYNRGRTRLEPSGPGPSKCGLPSSAEPERAEPSPDPGGSS
jgi:hypothetical protein